MKCSYCGSEKEMMTIQKHIPTGKIITLCFRGCQFFPEPYLKAVPNSEGDWIRIDKFIKKPKK